MKKVLITGGAGYIGSVLSTLLLEKGFQVTVVDKLIYNQSSTLSLFSFPHFIFHKRDVLDMEFMKPLLAKNDIIIPLAAIVGAPACKLSPVYSKSINLDVIKLILQHTSKSQYILFPNTNSGYGIGKENEFCDESSSLNPISLYGKQKVEAETEILTACRGVSFRLATVFGISARMRLDLLVNDFTYRACKDRFIVLFEPHFKRNFIHVRDVAYAFLFGIENYEKMKGQAFNTGLSSANLSKKELCEKIQNYLPSFYFSEAPIGEDPDKRNYTVSNQKLEKLGWKPRFKLDDGIREIISAYPVLSAGHFSNV